MPSGPSHDAWLQHDLLLAWFEAWVPLSLRRHGGHADPGLVHGLWPNCSGVGRTGQQLPRPGPEALLHAGLHQPVRDGIRPQPDPGRLRPRRPDAHVQLPTAGEPEWVFWLAGSEESLFRAQWCRCWTWDQQNNDMNNFLQWAWNRTTLAVGKKYKLFQS